MDKLIYFPGFEPENEDWLKFALLYLDCVRPIVPESADTQLTDTFREVERFTNLVDLLRPTMDEGYNATADAINQVERILRHPKAFEHVFGVPDIDVAWREREHQTTELWGEKFSYSWRCFCSENKLGRESDHGIVIPNSLAEVYMTILANCIADVRGMSPVSDDQNITDFSFFVRRSQQESADDEVSVLETSLPIVLPENLSDISINSVMQLRNSESFDKKRRAFQNVVQRVASSLEDGDDAKDLTDELGSTFKDFSDDIASIGTGLASLGFGMWLVASGAAFGPLDAIRQVLAGAAFTVGGMIKIRNSWEHSQVQRLARRYVADVRQLKANANPA